MFRINLDLNKYQFTVSLLKIYYYSYILLRNVNNIIGRD